MDFQFEVFKRVDEPTPNGGAYSITYFYDKNNQPCNQANAVSFHVHEYDSENNFICETIGYIAEDSKKNPKKKKKWTTSIIFGLFLIVILIVVLLVDSENSVSEPTSFQETTTTVYNAEIQVENGEDEAVDVDVSPINVSLTDDDLEAFENYISAFEVDYDFEDAYNIETALQIYNKNTVNSVTEHSHDIRLNGKFNVDHFYEIVKKNNTDFFESNDLLTSWYSEYSNSQLKKICQDICEALPAIAAADSTVDLDMACCYLYNIRILNKLASLDFAGFNMNNIFYINYDFQDNASFAMNTDDIELTTFYHEMMHAFQFACDDISMENEDWFGITHIYEELPINALSSYWFAEASAEMNMAEYLNVEYSTYTAMISYVESLKFISNISDGAELIKLEKLCFNKDLHTLFEAFDMTDDDEIREIIKMIFSIEILQSSDNGFYEWYSKEFGVDLNDDSNGEETYLRLNVKEDAMLTMIKMFYRNLARQVNSGNASLQDIYYLMRVMEADLCRHMSNFTVGYMLFFHNLYNYYIDIQDEFLHLIADENNLNFDTIVSEFENYSMNAVTKSPNCDLKFLSNEKKSYICDYFVDSFYKTGYFSMRECRSKVEVLTESISIEEMISNRAME